MGPLSFFGSSGGLADYGGKYTDFAAFIEQEALSTGINLEGETRTFRAGSNPTNPERGGRRSRA
jgi:hypothetical protein